MYCKNKRPLAKAALYLPDHKTLMLQETKICALVSSTCKFYSSFSMDLLSHLGHSASLQADSVAALTTL